MLTGKVERVTAERKRAEIAEAINARDQAVNVALGAVEAMYSGVQEFLPRFVALDDELRPAMDNAYRAEQRAAKAGGSALAAVSRTQDGWRAHAGLEQLALALRGYLATVAAERRNARAAAHVVSSGG